MVAIIEYKSSSTSYVINSVLNLALCTAKDLEETRNYCEANGGYFKILEYKTVR